jgi:uncharacterized protein (DUF433 family)
MQMAVSATTNHIEATAGVCGGKPRIAGHRIRVQDVALWHESLGMSADEIVSDHPGITLADVYAALAYYYDHRDDIRRDMEAEKAFVEAVQRSTPSRLVEKLTRDNAGENPIPS